MAALTLNSSGDGCSRAATTWLGVGLGLGLGLVLVLGLGLGLGLGYLHLVHAAAADGVYDPLFAIQPLLQHGVRVRVRLGVRVRARGRG